MTLAMQAFPEFSSKQLDAEVSEQFIAGHPEKVRVALAVNAEASRADLIRIASQITPHSTSKTEETRQRDSKPVRNVNYRSSDTSDSDESSLTTSASYDDPYQVARVQQRTGKRQRRPTKQEQVKPSAIIPDQTALLLAERQRIVADVVNQLQPRISQPVAAVAGDYYGDGYYDADAVTADAEYDSLVAAVWNRQQQQLAPRYTPRYNPRPTLPAPGTVRPSGFTPAVRTPGNVPRPTGPNFGLLQSGTPRLKPGMPDPNGPCMYCFGKSHNIGTCYALINDIKNNKVTKGSTPVIHPRVRAIAVLWKDMFPDDPFPFDLEQGSENVIGQV